MADKEILDAGVQDNVDELDESSAADTLKPGNGSGGGDTKAQVLSTFTQLLSQLGKEDLSNLFNRTLEQIGHEADKVPGSADANRNTVAMKPSSALGKGAWKEDVEDLFAGDELTEDFRTRAETVFEAALNTSLQLKQAELQEEFEEAIVTIQEELQEEFEKALEESMAAITDKVDQYMSYVVEQWMAENEIAIETSLRADIAENFISGLQNLFSEHYIRIPDEKIDLVAELKAELDDTAAQLGEAIDENIALRNVINEATVEAAIEEMSEGLTVLQADKFRTLAEGIEFDGDMDAFSNKLTIIKEAHFTKKGNSTVSTGLINESIDGDLDIEDDNKPVVPAHMSIYVDALAKSAKK